MNGTILNAQGRPFGPPPGGWPAAPATATAPAQLSFTSQPPVNAASMHTIQQTEEGVAQDDPAADPNMVLFKVRGSNDPGRYFRMSDRIGLMPLLRFAHSARGGVDSTDPKALIALYDMIADCIDQNRPQRLAINPETGQGYLDPNTGQPAMEDAGPSQWDDFQDYATAEKADDEDLMEMVGTVIEKISARSKAQRGSSPGGQAPTSTNSKDVSPSQATAPATGGRVPEGMEGLVSVSSLVQGQP